MVHWQVYTSHQAMELEKLLFISRVAAGAVASTVIQSWKAAIIDQRLILVLQTIGNCKMNMTMFSEQTLIRMCSSAIGTNS
jgi:hypothetical protein